VNSVTSGRGSMICPVGSAGAGIAFAKVVHRRSPPRRFEVAAMYRDCAQSDLNVTANPHAGWTRAVYRIVGSYPSGTRLAEAVRAG
jgi:hypothetical protein